MSAQDACAGKIDGGSQQKETRKTPQVIRGTRSCHTTQTRKDQEYAGLVVEAAGRKKKKLYAKYYDKNKCIKVSHDGATHPGKPGVCRYLGTRGYPRHWSAPVKIFCCKQMMHGGCLYAFLTNQYGYTHKKKRD